MAQRSPPSTVLQALRQYFAAEGSATADAPRRYIVATSGGPDSQALLDGVGQLARELNITAQAVGIDHGLRAGARCELELAQQLAHGHQLSFVGINVTLGAQGNVLAQARRLRYRALARAAKAFSAQAILVAHTANDQAETVLFHLARGAGLRGAAAMAPRRGQVHRPILEVSRAAVLEHLRAHNVCWAQDPSNSNEARSRTRMRHQVLPALCGINSHAIGHLSQFAARAHADNALLERMARRLLRKCLHDAHTLCTEALAQGPEALWPRVLHQWLRRLGGRPDGHALTRLLATVGPSGGTLQGGALAGCTVRQRGRLLWATPQSALPQRRAGTLPAHSLRRTEDRHTERP